MLPANGVIDGTPCGDPWSCCRLVDPISERFEFVVAALEVFLSSSDETDTNMASIWFVSSPADSFGMRLSACKTDLTEPGARCTVLRTSCDLCMVPRTTYT